MRKLVYRNDEKIKRDLAGYNTAMEAANEILKRLRDEGFKLPEKDIQELIHSNFSRSKIEAYSLTLYKDLRNAERQRRQHEFVEDFVDVVKSCELPDDKYAYLLELKKDKVQPQTDEQIAKIEEDYSFYLETKEEQDLYDEQLRLAKEVGSLYKKFEDFGLIRLNISDLIVKDAETGEIKAPLLPWYRPVENDGWSRLHTVMNRP